MAFKKPGFVENRSQLFRNAVIDLIENEIDIEAYNQAVAESQATYTLSEDLPTAKLDSLPDLMASMRFLLLKKSFLFLLLRLRSLYE